MKTTQFSVRILFLASLFGLIVISSCEEEEAAPKVSADFGSDKTKLLVGETVSFSDSTTNEPTTWEWIFVGGNPSTSTDQNPTVQYNEPGMHSVILIASNDNSCDTEIKENFIEVLSPVTTHFEISSSVVNQGIEVTFTDQSEGVPNGWLWEFEGGTPATSTNQNPTVVFNTSGIYSIKLTSSNELSSSSLTKEIIVLPTEGLVVHYTLNGDASDLSGNGNHGTLVGVSSTQNRNGEENAAYLFNGIDNKITFPYDESYNQFPITFSYWVNFNQLNSVVLSNDGVDGIMSGVWFSLGQGETTLGKLAINFGNGETPFNTNRKTFVTDEAMEIGKWYHVVGMIKSMDDFSIYIDGVEASGQYTGTATTYYHSGGSGNLGRSWDPASFFSGKLDDFRVFNRVLNENEIEALFKE